MNFFHQLTEALQPLESGDVFESDIKRALEADTRTPSLEPTLMKDPELAVAYAEQVIKGRWPEAEPIIRKNPEWAYRYAEQVIKGRWPGAESIIMKEPAWAYYYAVNVIQGRWPEAEPYIRKNHYWWDMYRSIPPRAGFSIQIA